MSHTLETVLEKLGDMAQLAGGSLVVNYQGKNVEVGAQDNSTGVFSLTEKGLEVLAELDAPAEKPKKQKTEAPKDLLGDLG